jgi:N-acetylneuraminate synthase
MIKTYVIAEIGINHNGAVSTALAMITSAAAAGCDAVKFQKRTVSVVYTPEDLARPRASIFGDTNGHLKRGLELSYSAYERIAERCDAEGVEWGVSCWDRGSLAFFDDLAPHFYKIASPCITDLKLVDATVEQADWQRARVMMSCGMSTEEQVNACVARLPVNAVIMHCVSEYPCPLSRCNVRRVTTLPVIRAQARGYSGHEGGYAPTLAAVALGAVVVERHFTLDRGMWGSDQKASVEPSEMREMVRLIRDMEPALGDGTHTITEGEIECQKKLRRV